MKNNNIEKNFYKQLKVLKNSKSICLISHTNPDTDALSSMEVMRDFLQNYFKIKTIDLFAEQNNEAKAHSDILESTILNPTPKTYDTAIVMDCPNASRIGKYQFLFDSANLKIVIDHHATNERQGNINIVEMRSSTCEIIYSITQYFKYKLSRKNLGKLYAGIITDTNNFSVGNYNSQTFGIVAKFIDLINKEKIHNYFLQNLKLKNFKLLALAINNIIEIQNGKIIISHISKEEADKFDSQFEDFTGIINRLATISNSLLVCFIYPSNNNYYVSLRSKSEISIADIAKKYSGGGHDGASAFISNLPINKIINIITEEFENKLANFKDSNNSIF